MLLEDLAKTALVLNGFFILGSTLVALYFGELGFDVVANHQTKVHVTADLLALPFLTESASWVKTGSARLSAMASAQYVRRARPGTRSAPEDLVESLREVCRDLCVRTQGTPKSLRRQLGVLVLVDSSRLKSVFENGCSDSGSDSMIVVAKTSNRW